MATNGWAVIHERIVVDPKIMAGQPVVKGTRIPVALVLKHLSQNLDLADLFEAYPRLTPDDVKACFAYAENLVAGELIYPELVPASTSQHR